MLKLVLLQELHILQVGDIHGWLYGHSENQNLGDIGTLVSYFERVEQNASEAAVLMFDNGDDCEGTGLSDAEDPRCSLIYELLQNVSFAGSVLGNHDLGSQGTMKWLKEHFNLVKTRQIATNIVSDSSGEHFGEFYKHITVKGVRVLILGFMYPGKNTYENLKVLEIEKVVESQYWIEMMKTVAQQTDFVVALVHDGVDSDLALDVYQQVRSQFLAFNYKVPIQILCGHAHKVRHAVCISDDNQCYQSEAGCYLKHIQHSVIQLNGIAINYNGSSFQGSYISHREVFPKTTFESRNLAERLKINNQEFDTPKGIQIRALVNEKVTKYKLQSQIGTSKFEFDASLNIKQQNSYLRLWMFAVVPALTINNDIMRQCGQLQIVRTAQTRGNIKKGALTLDDVIISMPYQYRIKYLANVSAQHAKCVFDWLNTGGWLTNHEKLPYYVVSDTSFNASCYDIILNEFEILRAQMAFDSCMMGFIGAQMYPTKTIWNRTDKIMQQFIRQYFLQEVQTDQDTSNKMIWIALNFSMVCVWLLSVSILGCILCRKIKQKGYIKQI